MKQKFAPDKRRPSTAGTVEAGMTISEGGPRRWLTTVLDGMVSGIASPMMSAARSWLWHWRFP